MGNGFDWNESPELNITPLVDVMLVLLSILMLATQAIVYEEKISLPQGSKVKSEQEVKKIVLRMDNMKTVYYEQALYPLTIFESKVTTILGGQEKTMPVFIRADKELRYQDVMTLLKSVKQVGFTTISLATDG